MKPVTIHPCSMLAGATLLALSLLVVGAVRRVDVGPAQPLNVVGIPDPRDMIVIRDGTPFTVPPDKLFVLTALGLTNYPSSGLAFSALLVNGTSVSLVTARTLGSSDWAYPINGGTPTVVEVPVYVAPGGATLEVTDSDPGLGASARAWGYLIEREVRDDSRGMQGSEPIEITGIQDPRTFVSFSGPGSQVIPQGKLLVVDAAADLYVDGALEVQGTLGSGVRKLPPGLTVHGGSVIFGTASGFLIDEKPLAAKHP